MMYPVATLYWLFLIIPPSPVQETSRYLNQTPPGKTPEIFAPGVVSLDDEYEFGSVFNGTGTELYYGVDVNGKSEIRYSALEGTTWSKPQVILSHEQWGYNDPFLSPDEDRLYFISQMPMDGRGALKDYDIWYVEKGEDDKWSQPINAGPHINSSANEYYISFTREGTMYFSSNKVDSNFDIFTSAYADGKFLKAQVLGDAINTAAYEADVFVDPNESYVIFCATRSGGLGQGDLYISFRDPDGSWTPSKSMGPLINTEGHELCPFVTLDGNYFFYTSNKDIYWVDASIVEDLR